MKIPNDIDHWAADYPIRLGLLFFLLAVAGETVFVAIHGAALLPSIWAAMAAWFAPAAFVTAMAKLWGRKWKRESYKRPLAQK